MKLWQKLMPVATAAATVACVVPMASCSKSVLSTSDKKFEPAQHAAVTDGLTQAKATEEYFKDKMNAANDICYNAAQGAVSQDESYKEYFVDYESGFSVDVASFTIGEEKKDVKISDTMTVTGFMVSGTIKSTSNVKGEKKLSDTEKEQYKKIEEQSSSSDTVSITNGFAFLYPTNIEKTPWTLMLYGIKSVSDSWVATTSGSSSHTTTNTGKIDGNTYTSVNSSNSSSKIGAADTAEATVIGSPYGFHAYTFDKVAYKAE